MDDFHRRLARIALKAAADHGFALAGGYAVQAHGVLQRPSEDIDLFTSSLRDDFAEGVAKICNAYAEHGLALKVDVDSAQFVRLSVSDLATGRTSKVELAADLRSHPPVTMEIGPVVHLDDVAGGRLKPCSPEQRSAISSMSTPSSPPAGSPASGCSTSPRPAISGSTEPSSPRCSLPSSSTQTANSLPTA